MNMDSQILIIVMGAAFILGLIFTVAYYFARYFFITEYDQVALDIRKRLAKLKQAAVHEVQPAAEADC